MKTPIVFLTFAQYGQKSIMSLPNIDDEKRELKKIIPHSQYFISEPKDPDELLANLQSFKDQITIFHYAGHSNSSDVQISDNFKLSNNNLIHFLSEEKNLKIVFLNSCDTEEYVKKLYEIHVPIIIASKSCSSILDRDAMNFSKSFYENLFNGNSIKMSFLKAKANIVPDGNKDLIYRDRTITNLDFKEFKMGLFYNREKNGLLNYNWRDLNEKFAPVNSHPINKYPSSQEVENIFIIPDLFPEVGMSKKIESPIPIKVMYFDYAQTYRIEPFRPVMRMKVRFEKGAEVTLNHVLEERNSIELNFEMTNNIQIDKWKFERSLKYDPSIIQKYDNKEKNTAADYVYLQIVGLDYSEIYRFSRHSKVNGNEYYFFILK